MKVDIDAEDNKDDDNNQDDYIEKIKLKNGPGTMRKRKTEAILQTRRYKIHSEPEKYYHSKLLQYYPGVTKKKLSVVLIHIKICTLPNKK